MGATGRVRSPKHRGVATLFTATTFLAAGLLFAVQPMVTRMLLPDLGGSAAAWNTAMVFFQGALLLGYVGAHISIRALGVRRHALVQVVALGLAGLTLPVAVPTGWLAPIEHGTELWTIGVLALMVGAPFVALATSSPTLQRWFATTDHPRASDPYFMYAAGNAGSLIALLAYPLVIERRIGVSDQSRLWTAGFVLLCGMTAACALVTRKQPDQQIPVSTGRVRWSNPRWILWAAVPSALLLGTTRHLATDVASVPLLWVVPLSLYLATFIAAFGRFGRASLNVGATVTAIVALPAVLAWIGATGLGAAPLLLHLVALTAVALLAHGRLAADRPPAQDLTGFYVDLSVGGALGGVLAALAAPLLFDRIYEYPLALAAGLALVPRASTAAGLVRSSLLQRSSITALLVLGLGTALTLGPAPAALTVALAAVACVATPRLPVLLAVSMAAATMIIVQGGAGSVLDAERTFFGVSRVTRSADGREHVLVSGTTVHGTQLIGREHSRQPTTYYSVQSPIGQVLAERQMTGPMDVGVIGLGAGTLASYAREHDRMTFYEIDPAVARIASDPSLFTYVADAPGDVSVRIGDGRLLAARAARRHDVLIVDAFSSDAIPVHLITQEAMATYRAALLPHGVIAVHVTNSYFDLVPVVTAIGAANGLEVRARHFSPADRDDGEASSWVTLAERGALPSVTQSEGWFEPSPGPVWTDDRTDLLGALDL